LRAKFFGFEEPGTDDTAAQPAPGGHAKKLPDLADQVEQKT